MRNQAALALARELKLPIIATNGVCYATAVDREILDVFFAIHDPTTRDRQGNDVGTQYRSAIFYHSEEQRAIAEEYVRADPAIVTRVEPASVFYAAEPYHQRYFENNPRQPYCLFVVAPKVNKFRGVFSGMLKT